MKKIASSLPVDKTAAMVTQKGTSFVPKIKPHSITVTDIRPQIWNGTHLDGFDLTGKRFGRFTVIGLSAEKRSRWVCRCDCGNYEMRRAKSVQNPANDFDRCIICRKTLYITTGKDIAGGIAGDNTKPSRKSV